VQPFLLTQKGSSMRKWRHED